MPRLLSETETKEELRDQALFRSIFYGAAALALHFPDVETCGRLRSPDTIPALRHAALRIGTAEPAVTASLSQDPAATSWCDLTRRAEDWIATLPFLQPETLLPIYGRLFGHTARSPVCPYETEYGPEALFQQPRQ